LQKFHAHVTMWGGNNVQQQQNSKKTFESKVTHLPCLLAKFLSSLGFPHCGKKKPLRIWRDQLRHEIDWGDFDLRPKIAKDQQVSKFYIQEFGQR
jgi:hypothetical protein